MDTPIGNWSPDKPVIRKSLSRASKEQRAGYSFVHSLRLTRPVGGHLDSSKKNVSQCERFKKFPSACFHTCFDPSTFFSSFFKRFVFPKRGGAQSIAPLHLSGIRLRNLNAEGRTIKFMQRKNDFADDRINPSKTERVHHRVTIESGLGQKINTAIVHSFAKSKDQARRRRRRRCRRRF